MPERAPTKFEKARGAVGQYAKPENEEAVEKRISYLKRNPYRLPKSTYKGGGRVDWNKPNSSKFQYITLKNVFDLHMFVHNENMKILRPKFTRYDKAIAILRKQAKARERRFKQAEDSRDSAQLDYQAEKAKYEIAIKSGRLLDTSEEAESWRKSIESLRKAVPNAQNESEIYFGDYYDIDDPKKVVGRKNILDLIITYTDRKSNAYFWYQANKHHKDKALKAWTASAKKKK